MELRFQTKNKKEIFTLHRGAVPYLSFRALDETGLFRNAFSTRLGGVSTGCRSSMNLIAGKAGDAQENILENHRRMAKAVGFSVEKEVLSYQTHTTNVREATEADFGKGLLRERDYRDVDGLVTNVPGLTLVTVYADCVPLYIADPVHRAIGLSHSGWRGTVGGIGQKTIERMQALYGSCPEDLICCIGPSICRDCFEVGGEVAEEFLRAFGEESSAELIFRKQTPEAEDGERAGTAGGKVSHAAHYLPLGARERIDCSSKYYVDLWRANALRFLRCGVPEGHIVTTNLCTHCNPELLWSHRSFGTERGNLGAFFSIREEE